MDKQATWRQFTGKVASISALLATPFRSEYRGIAAQVALLGAIITTPVILDKQYEEQTALAEAQNQQELNRQTRDFNDKLKKASGSVLLGVNSCASINGAVLLCTPHSTLEEYGIYKIDPASLSGAARTFSLARSACAGVDNGDALVCRDNGDKYSVISRPAHRYY